MDTKLTLSLDKEIIEKAKDFARSKNTSLSALVENYLQRLTEKHAYEATITPLVKGMSGVIYLPEDFDRKKAYADHLINKYK